MIGFDSMGRLAQKVYTATSVAKCKHPFPFARVTEHSIMSVKGLLARTREANERETDGGDFLRVAMEELFEYCEASLEGDRKRAERELLDVFAVLVKEYERLERDGATFAWGEHFMTGDSHG